MGWQSEMFNIVTKCSTYCYLMMLYHASTRSVLLLFFFTAYILKSISYCFDHRVTCRSVYIHFLRDTFKCKNKCLDTHQDTINSKSVRAQRKHLIPVMLLVLNLLDAEIVYRVKKWNTKICIWDCRKHNCHRV